MRTLVTGFGAFGDVEVNPSAQLALSCGRDCLVLEVSYRAVLDWLDELDASRWDRVLMLGVQGRSAAMQIELRGKAEIGPQRDVRGEIFQRDNCFEESLPSTLWSPNALESLAKLHAWKQGKLTVSEDAGSFLCNFGLFETLVRFPSLRVGFLHVPQTARTPLGEQQSILQELLGVIEQG